MLPEIESQLPSNQGQGAPLAPPVINDASVGLSDSEAAARIRQKLSPQAPRAADGRFASQQAPVEQPAAPPRQAPLQPADGAESITEPDDGAEPATPDDDLEFDDGTEAEPAQAPSLEMPESWSKSTAETWQSFTPEQQQFLKQQDAKRTQGITRQMNELKAAEEKAAQREQAIKEHELQVGQASQRYATAAERDFLSKFSDLKSQEDVVKLATDNPARYLQYDASLKAAMASRQEAQMFEQREREGTLKQLQDFRVAENTKLAELAGLKDEASATAFEKEVHDATDALGIPRERVAQYRAEEALLVRDAMRYRKAMAKKQAALKAASPPPKVIRPGTQPASQSLSQEAHIQQLSQKLRKTGDEKVAAELIRAKMFRR